MEKSTEAILLFLLNRHYIGAKHFPERKLVISRTKWLNNVDKKAFDKEYLSMLKADYFIRLKKKTGKGTEWHISLNPEKLKEIFDMVEKNVER
jgi:hypothetical protein